MDSYTVTFDPEDVARLQELADRVQFSAGRPEWKIVDYVRWALSQTSVAAGLPAWPHETATTGYRLIMGGEMAAPVEEEQQLVTPPAAEEAEPDDGASPVSDPVDFDVMPPGVVLKERPPERRNKKGGA